MEATIPEFLEESSNELSTAADGVPVEEVNLASRHLATIVRSVHAFGGRFADLVHKVVELQAEAQDLAAALAGLRNALRRVADFGTRQWFAQVARKIDPRTTTVTTGLVFDSTGRHLKTIESGCDELSALAQDTLTYSKVFPKPSSWRSGHRFAVSDHAETKVAVWLRRTGGPCDRQHVVVVINKDQPCRPPYGCQVAVRSILPRGTSMTVISTVTGLRWSLKGVVSA